MFGQQQPSQGRRIFCRMCELSKTTYMTPCFHVCVNTCVQLPIPEVNEERCWEMEGSEQTPPGQTAGSRTRSNSTSGYTAVSKWWRLNRLIQIPPNIYMEKTPGRPLTFNTGPLIHPALFNSQGWSLGKYCISKSSTCKVLSLVPRQLEQGSELVSLICDWF